MNPFFKENRKLIEKEILASVQRQRVAAGKAYPWSDDALTRLESFSVNGKMIRGLLILLAAGKKSPVVIKDAITLGAALEVMHSGILIHDDVMDRDALRRGSPTMHTQYIAKSKIKNNSESLHYGEGMANCVGIVAYFIAFGQFSRLRTKDSVQPLVQLFSSEMALLGLGQMDDFTTGFLNASDEASCLRIYQQKTGRYTFGLPLIAGFELAAQLTPAVRLRVQRLAESLGIIFQLKDDYLGIFGNHKKTGKSVGGDIRERKKTWIYFKLLSVCTSTEKKKLEKLYTGNELISKPDQLWILSLLQKYELPKLIDIELSSQKDKALRVLQALPFDERQQNIMKDLLDYLLIREK